MRKIQVAIVVLMIFSFLAVIRAIYGAWTEEILLKDQFIPTSVNGMATSTALAVGFAATSLTLGFSNKFFSGEGDIFVMFMLLLIAVSSVVSLSDSYHQLALGELQTSFRYAMTGFHFAVLMLFDGLLFLLYSATRIY